MNSLSSPVFPWTIHDNTIRPFLQSLTRRDYPSIKKGYSIDWNATGVKLAIGSQEQAIRIITFSNSFANHINTIDLKGHVGAVISLKFDPSSAGMGRTVVL